MTRGPPQRYKNRVTCSVSIEKDLKDVGQALDISFPQALVHGLTFLIDYKLKTGEKVPVAILEKWRNLKEDTLHDLQEYLHIEKTRQEILSNIMAEHRDKERDLMSFIRVWNNETEKYEDIPKIDYNPVIHTIVRRKNEGK